MVVGGAHVVVSSIRRRCRVARAERDEHVGGLGRGVGDLPRRTGWLESTVKATAVISCVR
jgi:hypothetical protein